jgi:uncharacterized protein DUF4333
MSPAVRLCAMAAIALLSSAAAYGCGGTVVSKEKVDDTTQASLERSLHEKIKSVDCPSGQPVDPGSTFECAVVFPDGKRESAILKIRDKDADISIVGLKPNK